MKKVETPTRTGRPRQFDTDQALDTAMHLFWRKGYDGTSISDLTDAIGVNRPSLYAAFGNKRELFHKALEKYIGLRNPKLEEALAKPTSKEVVETLLQFCAEFLTCNEEPGCLTVQGALACSDEAREIHEELGIARELTTTALRLRLQKAQRENDLPEQADPNALAQYVSTVVFGMAVQASAKATREDLLSVATIALKAWSG